VSGDGGTLLVSSQGSGGVCEYDMATGAALWAVGARRFKQPHQVCVAPDGFVFIADAGHHRVQVLTPDLALHRCIGEGRLIGPVGVCANADVVVVTGHDAHRLSVFSRADGTLLTHIPRDDGSVDRTDSLRGLCFVHGNRRVAVADHGNGCVMVFSVDGEFVRHVGVGVLKNPSGVACSSCDELVVADTGNCRVRVFSDVGDLLMTMGDGFFTGVVVHGAVVLATDPSISSVIVWS
jgi:DNA-binding beta-propeller fold protein YncE